VIREADTAALERCMEEGEVAVFPADTVYGLACDPESSTAVSRLYALKGRSAAKPAAVMFFDRELAFAALPELPARTRAALERLLPGGVTALLANPARRFPLACGPVRDTLGLRVPALSPPLAPLAAVRRPVLQSSANRAGGPDPRRLADVDESIRAGAGLVLDGGELPGTPSTVVDLRRYEQDRSWEIVREGATARAEVKAALR
jgi:L-threonylcarbamoyladenylate synthase